MVLSTSQQVALAFTAVLFTFVVLPRIFGVGGTGAKETRFDPRYSKHAGAARVPPANPNEPGSSQTAENMQQMKKLMEQELKSDKFKSNSNKGYVFTLMPLYAVGVGVFAAYKFLKIKSADDQAQKQKVAKGTKKSVEAETQLNELEQRLAQTERMLNSILTQLDPLTSCVKSVAQDQKNEIMSQLQTIRSLMKKRGMDCPPLTEASCERNLDDLIETLGAEQPAPGAAGATRDEDGAANQGEEMKELVPEEEEEGEQEEGKEEGWEATEVMPSLEDSYETNMEEVAAERLASGLRRRTRPD